MCKVTLVFSALSFVASATTLGVLIYGSRKVQDDIRDVRSKSNEAITKMKSAIHDIQL